MSGLTAHDRCRGWQQERGSHAGPRLAIEHGKPVSCFAPFFSIRAQTYANERPSTYVVDTVKRLYSTSSGFIQSSST